MGGHRKDVPPVSRHVAPEPQEPATAQHADEDRHARRQQHPELSHHGIPRFAAWLDAVDAGTDNVCRLALTSVEAT
jgi:hypothetical protein